MRKHLIKKIFASGLAAAMAISPLASMALTAHAAGTAIANDLKDADIIDENAKGSIHIWKYDMTSAQNDGIAFNYSDTDHDSDGADSTLEAGGKEIRITSDGKKNEKAEEILKEYAVKGVEFSYLRVGDVKTLSGSDDDKVNGDVELVYGIDDDLMAILGLQPFDGEGENKAEAVFDDVNYFTSQQINEALKARLNETQYNDSYATGEEEGKGASQSDGERMDKEAGVTVKDQLESYIKEIGTTMALTDANGETGIEDIDLGLYLIAETKAPENVVNVTNPWFVQVPMTDLDGESWFYDISCYPKNQTGHPDLDKLVRNAYGTAGLNHDSNGPAAYTKGDKVSKGDEYSMDSKIVSDSAGKDDLGGWLSDKDKKGDYTYNSTVTASEGDVLDYILVSRLPRITSSSTYLTTYELRDTLSAGLHYNNDLKVAIYGSEQSAKANDTSHAIDVWTEGKDALFTCTASERKEDGSTVLQIAVTDKGLAELNKKYYDGAHYMVAYYTANVGSDAATVLGDDGNPNDVTLVWQRTSEGYYNTLEDRCIVYTYGIDLTKTFSDGKAKAEDFKAVQFILYNKTEGYYVQAKPSDAEGLYYVTGKAASKDKATVFSPSAEGKMVINGLEGDDYAMTEIHTAKGYSILKGELDIMIKPADCDITASSVHYMTAAEDHDTEHPEDAHTLVLSDGTQLETEEEGTTDKQNMLIGDIKHSTATVDSKKADMCVYGAQSLGKESIAAAPNGKDSADSENADVLLAIENAPAFGLPQTGGAGLYAAILIGFTAVFAGSRLLGDKKKRC